MWFFLNLLFEDVAKEHGRRSATTKYVEGKDIPNV